MKIKIWAAVLVVMVTSQAMAAPCTSTQILGVLAQPGTSIFANGFLAPLPFNDCYNFSIANDGGLTGMTLALAVGLSININSVTLTGGGSTLFDNTPSSFGWSGLSSGSYQLAVAGTVTGSGGAAGYGGKITTSVPEPGTLGLFGIALVGLAIGAKRRQVRR